MGGGSRVRKGVPGISDDHGLKSKSFEMGEKSRGSHSEGSFRKVIPQIAIAIGVLTSNRGEGDEPLWRIGRGTRVPLQGAVDVVPLLGAIVGCHCSVEGEGDDQLWGSGRGAIAGCHCGVPL